MKPVANSSRALAIAWLNAVLVDGLTLDEAQVAHAAPLAEADTRYAKNLALTVLRHVGQLDALIAKHLDTPLTAKNQPVQQALRIGAAQLLLLDTPAHAAVNETVEAIKHSHHGLAPLVNAVLQKLAAEKPALPSAGHNLPAWWGTRLDAHYGVGTAKAIAAIAVQRPPLDVNFARHCERSEAIHLADATQLDECIFRLPADHPPVETLSGYAEGDFFVQDVAASYPARLLGEVQGLRVLDLCAAPGGKTAQLARAGAKVTALDRSEHRLKRLRENMVRLKLDVEIIAADALAWEPQEKFDAILLDAPCSATGTWRRHPEVVRLATPEKIMELAVLQRQLLTRAWGWLKQGGRLIYCVCSLEPEEGEQQAEWFVHDHKDAKILPATITMHKLSTCVIASASDPKRSRERRSQPIHLDHSKRWSATAAQEPPRNDDALMLRTLPHMLAEQGGMDGFFATMFEKR